MPTWKPLDLGQDALLGVLAPGKLYQVIFNVWITTTPTSVRITYVPMLDAFGFVTLFQDDIQIRGLGATSYAPGYYGVTFTDLPQNTLFTFRIDVVDPRPKGAQLPGGIVHLDGIAKTGFRTATVHLRQ